MYTYLAIAFGGALGALSRHWLTSAMENLNGTDFPLGTFVVNLFGSFLIGLVFVVFAEKLSFAEQWRPVIIIGFLDIVIFLNSLSWSSGNKSSQYSSLIGFSFLKYRK